jgi:AcrR family transcriptional regulator
MAALPAPRPNLRDERARDTRARLIEAAIALVIERGWPSTTVERIAARAGVAKGTFFVHFPTKEAIVLALVEKQITRALARRDEAYAQGATPLERLASATLELGVQAAANGELSRAVLIASLESREVGGATDAIFARLYVRMRDDAREAVLEGEVDRVSPDMLAQLFMGCYLGAALQCTSVPNAPSISEVLRVLVDTTVNLARKRKPTKTKATNTRRKSR